MRHYDARFFCLCLCLQLYIQNIFITRRSNFGTCFICFWSFSKFISFFVCSQYSKKRRSLSVRLSIYLIHKKIFLNIHYNLRRTEDFFIPLIRNTSILRKPLYFFASTWNSLDPAVSQEAERKIFINKLKAHFFSQLDYINCIKPVCLTCQFLN